MVPGSEAAGALIDQLGISIDPELLVLALTHRSFAHEAGGIPTNERLEFLGDSVLGVFVTEKLYRTHPHSSEGELAKMRAATVSQRPLAQIARELGIGRFILLGKGETTSGGSEKDSILSDTMEALIGAVYMTNGVEPTREFVERITDSIMERAETLGAGLDWKTSLQELASARKLGEVHYRLSGDGPAHAQVFTAEAIVDNDVLGTGKGSSKKVAEQLAAERGYGRLLDSTTVPATAEQSDGPASSAAH